jgi:hypothetical protein
MRHRILPPGECKPLPWWVDMIALAGVFAVLAAFFALFIASGGAP